LHFLPYVTAIYGVDMEIITKSVLPGTSIITPRLFLQSLWKARPWGQQRDPKAKVPADWPSGLNQKSFLRMLANQARRENVIDSAELVFATWHMAKLGSAPPFAVVMDHNRKEIVITVRGTKDVNDCLTDIAAVPVYFNPLRMNGLEETNEAQGAEIYDTGFFVHEGMATAAQNLLERMQGHVDLHDLLRQGGRGSGYRVVVCGHSLGAGIACLVAFLLAAKLPDIDVQYMGFEPPGGLLSRSLAEEAQRRGWKAAVCAHDWVPRLTLKAVHEILEQAIDELVNCNRSKLQLTLSAMAAFFFQFPFLRCLFQPIGRCLRCLAGGPIPRNEVLPTQREGLKEQVLNDNSACPDLFPPGHLAYFKPCTEIRWLGFYEIDVDWTMEWIEPEQLRPLILAARAMELHLPNLLEYAFRKAASNKDTQER